MCHVSSRHAREILLYRRYPFAAIGTRNPAKVSDIVYSRRISLNTVNILTVYAIYSDQAGDHFGDEYHDLHHILRIIGNTYRKTPKKQRYDRH